MWITILQVLGYIWIILAGLLIFAGIVGTWMAGGLSAVQELLSPFNIANFIATLITLAPGLGALMWAAKLREKRVGPKSAELPLQLNEGSVRSALCVQKLTPESPEGEHVSINADKPKANKTRLFGCISSILVVLIFVGARQFTAGGIRQLIGDFITESSLNPRVKELSDEMLTAFIPIGAAAICLNEYGKNAGLKKASVAYNNRNRAAMERLIASIKAAGGMSNSEKDLVDRKVYQQARHLLDQGHHTRRACDRLANRINSGEFDADLNQ
jgi:hypothetical protein